MQSNSLKMKVTAFQRQTVKVFVVASDLLGEDILNLFAETGRVEIIGRSRSAYEADAIFQLQPQVVIHSSSTNEEDGRLMEKISKDLPDSCYIALGDCSDLMFRIRCNAAGVNHILDRRNGLSQILRILQLMISKLSEDDETPRYSGLMPGI